MPLVGHVYIQDSDPGTPPSGGYEWFKPTSQDVYIRNGANTAWVLKGNASQDRLGNVPVGGAAMTGPIIGGHGLAPLASPDFQTSSKRDGKNLALRTDLNAMANTLRSEFSSVAAGLIAGALSTSSTRGNIAMGMGTSTYTGPLSPDTEYFQIPLPQYPDLTTAKETECVWIPSIAWITFHDSVVSSHTVTVHLDQSPTDPRSYKCWVNDSGLDDYSGKFHYMIIGVR